MKRMNQSMKRGDRATISVSKKTHADFEGYRAELSAERGKAQTQEDAIRALLEVEVGGKELTTVLSQCWRCKHFCEDSIEGLTCDAYPAKSDAYANGIPIRLWLNEVAHDTPYPGDHGIRFTPKK